MAFLLLWLEAPMQSWGHDSLFGRRDSLEFPTKSGVLGLICCARGAGGSQEDWLSRWHAAPMEVRAYARKGHLGIQAEPALSDFQMVGNGYDDQDPWETLLIPKTRDGKKAVGGGAKLTHRYYIQDMAYAVVLECPDEHAEEVAAALQTPVWDIYLGRKSCAPTDMVFRGAFSTKEEALSLAAALAEQKERGETLSVVDGAFPGEGEVLQIKDVPLSFGVVKRYKDRVITVRKTV